MRKALQEINDGRGRDVDDVFDELRKELAVEKDRETPGRASVMNDLDADLLSAAVRALRGGGLVAFPTETVYGLGADATDPAAVRKIFAAKGRPCTNPLIVHVADAAAARRYAAAWPGAADALAGAFWPGPLTLVLPKAGGIVAEVTAGRDTVGLRVPNHPVALDLLRAFDGPLAGPSANRSTKVSPTTAGHVRSELGDRVDVVLDGGPCRVGIESTVLDLSTARPTILRPGGVTREQIEAVIGPVELFSGTLATDVAAASPGLHAVHYSPSTPTYRFDAEDAPLVAEWCCRRPIRPAVLLLIPSLPDAPLIESASAGHHVVYMPGEPKEYAQKLYAALHAADGQGAAAIWVRMPSDAPEWTAVRDRLTRAGRKSETRNQNDEQMTKP